MAYPRSATFDPAEGGVVMLEDYNLTLIVGTHQLGSWKVYLGNSTWAVDMSYATSDGYLEVANYNRTGPYLSDFWGNVSMLSGASIVASVPVGLYPGMPTFDPVNGYVYVDNYLSDTISVINGVRVIATIPVGITPEPPVIDTRSGYVYVPNSGSDNVSVIDGTSLIDSIPVGQYPYLSAYNPRDDRVYIPDTLSQSVTEIEGTNVVANVSTSAEGASAIFDPANGYVYVSNQWTSGPRTNNVTVLNGTQVVGVLDAPRTNLGGFWGVEENAYDPLTRLLVFPGFDQANVSLISTSLGVGPITPTVENHTLDYTDVGIPISFHSNLTAIGTGNDSASESVTPASGLGCASSPTFTHDLISGNLSLTCTPTAPGNYTVWLNVTDTAGKTAWSYYVVRVLRDPSASLPVGLSASGSKVTSTDIFANVSFLESPANGTGNYSNFTWEGIPTGACPGLPGPRLECLFDQPATLEITVTFSDGLMNATSGPLTFTIYSWFDVSLPTSDPGSVDVGQSVLFGEAPSGGTGVYNEFAWNGLSPQDCLALDTATPSCTFTTPGDRTVSAIVTDSNGVVEPSPELVLPVYSAPTVTAVTLSRHSVDVSQSVRLTVGATGGLGPYDYIWQGLPSACSGANESSPVCYPKVPGALSFTATVKDQNGGVSAPSPPANLSVYSDPTVSTPTVSVGTVTAGSEVTIQVRVFGGAGGNTVHWVGLPPGCTSSATQFSCIATTAGNYSISAEVTDANGFRANSTAVRLVVTPETGPWGLSGAVFYGIVGVVIVAVSAAVLAVWKRSRSARRRPPLPPPT